MRFYHRETEGTETETFSGVPAQAGTRSSVAGKGERWVPAFAGTPSFCFLCVLCPLVK
jgi:hypothetical protein